MPKDACGTWVAIAVNWGSLNRPVIDSHIILSIFINMGSIKMKIIGAVLAFVCLNVSAQVQQIELQTPPPLKPLNWCTHADGVTRGQTEECGPGTTVGSSISTAQPAPKEAPAPASPSTKIEASVSKSEPGSNAQSGLMGRSWKDIAKWAVLAIILGFLIRFVRARL
jgi:hypothetical protein